MALAAIILSYHLVGWTVRVLWPSLVDLLWLPSGTTWKASGMTTSLRFSVILSLLISLLFVGCSMEAQHSKPDQDVPLICRGGWYDVQEGEMPLFLQSLGKLSLVDNNIGTLWLSALALFGIYRATRRSSRLSIRARVKAAMRVDDLVKRTEALWQTKLEEGYVSGGGSPQKRKTNKLTKPQFEEMCEWYSLAVVDTAVSLLISLKLFFGRFDLRTLRRPKNYDEVDESFADAADDESGSFYFDWLGDTGDGGDSTYSVARNLAKKVLYVRRDAKAEALLVDPDTNERIVEEVVGDLALPRPRLMIIGGDLVYPSASIEEYDRRLFVPFGDALEFPPSYNKESVSTTSKMWTNDYKANRERPPVCYALAGNHDHIDGLSAFSRVIFDRDWLGGWHLPQTTSYFCLKFPHDWWMFAFDQGLGEDIDADQFRYFAHVARTKVKSDDRIIVATHEPVWLYDAYREGGVEERPLRSPMLKELLRTHLGDRVALRLCGDLHNYQRYDEVNPKLDKVEVSSKTVKLVISGGGGAFLHPTHTWPERVSDLGVQYERARAYPDVGTSRALGWENLGSGFRIHNWRFDLVGATLYFLVCFSLFPRCGLKDRIVDVNLSGEMHQYFINVLKEMVGMVYDAWMHGIISPLAMIGVFAATISFAEADKGKGFQMRLGFAHGAAHLFFAFLALILCELCVEIAIADGLAGRSFYSLFESFVRMKRGVVPPTHWTDGTIATVTREILRAFDLPEAIAVSHAKWCADPATFATSGRWEVLSFYFASFFYSYVLSADAVSLVIGVYLAVSVSLLNVHWNESFSSLRHRHLKSFVRLKIDGKTGNLHGFVLGIDRVPKNWTLSEHFETTKERMLRTHVKDELDPSVASYGAAYPSKWVPSNRREAMQATPRLVDYFVCARRSGGAGVDSSANQSLNTSVESTDANGTGDCPVLDATLKVNVKSDGKIERNGSGETGQGDLQLNST